MQPSSLLLSPPAKKVLKAEKNLLAFSAGVDSSALFFLLLAEDIPFDIAIVDYGLREASKEELRYAKELAFKHDKICYHDSVHLPTSNFEHHARTYRYHFFEQIIKEKGYSNLITAHQLNDRLEWFLMQLGRGAGLVEMLGFEEIEERKGYRLIRPLINTAKSDLLDYLQSHNKTFFIDESNADEKYHRNHIRAHFSDAFVKEYQDGLLKSFAYLQSDKNDLLPQKAVYQDQALTLLQHSYHDSLDIRAIDRALKERGYLLSAAQKKEILRKKEAVIADKIVISWSKTYIYIAPFITASMPKAFKELCRRLQIPAKIRPYLLVSDIDPSGLPPIDAVS